MTQAQMINSAEVAQFRWKHRLLLIVSEDTDFIKKQQEVITDQRVKQGWEERKLKWIVLSPHGYQLQNEPWVLNRKLYREMENEIAKDHCILVGLDGSIKLKSKGIVSIKEIFDLTDTMPMRRSERKQ